VLGFGGGGRWIRGERRAADEEQESDAPWILPSDRLVKLQPDEDFETANEGPEMKDRK
jgi:hypothetical protein